MAGVAGERRGLRLATPSGTLRGADKYRVLDLKRRPQRQAVLRQGVGQRDDEEQQQRAEAQAEVDRDGRVAAEAGVGQLGL